MKKSNFDQLMDRYLRDEVTEQEKTKIEAWLDTMKTENTTNLELSKADEEKLYQKITNNLDNLNDIKAFHPEKEHSTSSGSWILRIAATLLILISATILIRYVSDKTSSVQPVAITDQEKVILNDGTLVWLKNGSSLTYYEKPQEGIRYTQFEGEALFEVAKNPEQPFVIQWGDVNLRVLGTSFSLKTGNELELVVLTGKVNLSSAKNQVNIDVTPNEKVIYRQTGDVKKQPLDEADRKTIVADTEYNMQFNNTNLNEVLKKVEQKFEVQITLTNKQIGKCRITADFTDNSLESTLNLITEVLDIEYTQKGKTITITGKGCE